MDEYKWPTSHAWLKEKGITMSKQKLFEVFCAIVDKLDQDEIQDIFQSDMEKDGYFKKVT